MVLADDESLWVTGANSYGQLGDGSTITKNKYVKVLLEGELCAVFVLLLKE